MRDFVRKHAVRIAAVAAVLVPALAARYAPDLPVPAVLEVVAFVLALAGGEVAQRVENRKTAEGHMPAEDDDHEAAE